MSEHLFPIEQVDISTLKEHPRNYQQHPDDELDHIEESIREHGFYRNIILAQDGTILAGHGVVKAARRMGITRVPALRTAYAPDDPQALKLLVGDNEIQHLAEVDDRALTELLRELKDADDISGLLGTGYDEMMLANLLMVSRPTAEIADLDAAAHWVGMPDYGEADGQIQITVHFANEEDRLEFFRRLDLDTKDTAKRKSIWWPDRENDDKRAVLFAGRREGDGDE